MNINMQIITEKYNWVPDKTINIAHSCLITCGKMKLQTKLTFSVRQLGSQLWLIKRPRFPFAHASITWIQLKQQ